MLSWNWLEDRRYQGNVLCSSPWISCSKFCWIPWISCSYPLDGSPILQLDLTQKCYLSRDFYWCYMTSQLVEGWWGGLLLPSRQCLSGHGVLRHWPHPHVDVMNFLKVVDRRSFGGWWTIVFSIHEVVGEYGSGPFPNKNMKKNLRCIQFVQIYSAYF